MKRLLLLLSLALAEAAPAQGRVTLPESGVAHSPDGAFVAFVRPAPEHRVVAGSDSVDATELWLARADGSHAQRLVRGRPSHDMRIVLGDLSSPSFSPDGRRVYFLSRAWVTSAAVHVVEVATRRTRFVAAGNSLEVVPSGDHAGCLLVNQHRYWMAGGSYDWTWLLTARGRVVGAVVGDDDDAEPRLAEWRELNAKGTSTKPGVARASRRSAGPALCR